MPRDPSPYVLDNSGRWQFAPHPGQQEALQRPERFILVLAGWQSGKTLIGPRWMLEEIARCGPGDYLVASPTYPLMSLKVLPEYKDLFERKLGLGTLRENPRPLFTFNDRGRRFMQATGSPSWQEVGASPETLIRFGHAADPDSLESATFKAAHLDEAGQKTFKRASYDAIRGRLSIHQGRVLFTTRPYYIGWLKHEVHDRVQGGDPDYALVHFRSIDNPAFPRDEWEERKRTMPPWKFALMYEGRFTRPAGQIYDCWQRDVHCVPQVIVPADWPRHLGLDFGGVNTAGPFLAREPSTQRYVAYRCYHAGGRTAAEHVTALREGEPAIAVAVGGARSEGQWRREFRAEGLRVQEPPIRDVEVGIDRLYAMLKNHPTLPGHDPDAPYLEVMEHLDGLIDEFETYSRILDENDEPTDKIENKASYHRLDGLRYLACKLMHPAPTRRRATSHSTRRLTYG